MLMKQSPGLGEKYAKFYSLNFYPDFQHICQIWYLVQEAMEMNKIVFYHERRPKRRQGYSLASIL